MIECYYDKCRHHPKTEPFCCEDVCLQEIFVVYPNYEVYMSPVTFMSDDYTIVPATSEAEALEIYKNLEKGK